MPTRPRGIAPTRTRTGRDRHPGARTEHHQREAIDELGGQRLDHLVRFLVGIAGRVFEGLDVGGGIAVQAMDVFARRLTARAVHSEVRDRGGAPAARR